jgi:TolB-like protein
MKTSLIIRLLFTLGLVTSALAQTPDPAATPLPMAVFDFQTTDRSLEKKGGEVAVLLNARLSVFPEVFLVERQEIEKILGEQEAGISGAVNAETAAKVGALVGAKVLVTGRVFEAGGKVYVVAKIMSTETGRVYGELVTAKNFDAIDPAVEELAGKIAQLTQKQAATLVAKVEEPAARIERLKKLTEGKTLPAIYVSIAEQHLARAVIDPAVQTEMMIVLKEIGFPVVTAQEAAERTDVVVISGEAFSELGMRRGNLVSCRARVEITVTQAATKKLLHVDRQMDVAIDIAEHSAGKKALENAALKLLDRVVPQLVK